MTLRESSHIALLAGALALAFSSVGAAQEANLSVPVRGGIHADYNRMVFDLPSGIKPSVEIKAGEVVVTLPKPVTLKPDRLVDKLSRIKIDSADSPHQEIRLRTAAGANVKHFMSGNSLVLDVKGAKAAVAVPAIAPTTAPVVAAETAKAEVPAPPAPATPTAPSAPAAEATVAPPVSPTDVAALLGQPQVSTPVAQPAAPTVVPANISSPVLPTIQNLGATPQLYTQFDPKVSLPAAIYARGDFLYIVFDRRLRFDLAQLFDASALAKAEAVAVGGVSMYRVPLASNGRPLVTKAGTRWQVDVVAVNEADVSSEAIAAQGLRARLEPEFSLGARVVIPFRGVGQVVSLADPVVGDALFLVPATNIEDHVVSTRRFADFELIPTFQGVVIRALNDALSVRLVEEGVEITAPQGLRLLPPTVAAEAAPAVRAPKEDVIPLKRWQQAELGTFTEGRQVLQQRIVDAIPAMRDRARLDLARYFIAYAYGAEAESLLSLIAEKNPDIVGRPEYQILKGVAHVLSHESDDGIKAFEASKLSDRDDVRLWRAVAFAEQRNFTDAAADFGATMLLLEDYAQPFFQRFALLAAESFIATEDDTNASRVLDAMRKRLGPVADTMPSVQYLQGVVQARSGSLDIARKQWEKAAKGTDYLSRARAELALVDMDLAAGKIQPADAARRLEGLRFAWRGDELELEILARLAEYQLKLNKPLDALDTFERAKTIFPNSSRQQTITEQQQKIFREVFLGSLQNQFTPLQMLSIYDRFKALAPADPAESQQIVDRVVDDMLAIDLLPQATKLLEERINTSTDPAAKTIATLRLAAVHLLNTQADAASTLLNGMDVSALSAEQAQERKLMLARAASDQDRFQQAFELLAGDTNRDAQRLLATTAWRAKDWPRAATALGDVVPVPGEEGLKADEAPLVLARAVALTLANDRDGLDRLSADFSKAMEKTPQAQAFALLTRSDLTAGAASLARVREQVSNVDLFQGFLENYRKAKTN